MANNPINSMPKNPTDRRFKQQLLALLYLRRNLDVTSRHGFGFAMGLLGGAQALHRELVRPAAPVYDVGLEFENYEDLSREEIRVMASVAIREGFPLPEGLASLIANALEDLNSGGMSWIVEPTPGRRGKVPDAFDWVKIRICLWIRFQQATGRSLVAILEEDCKPIGHSQAAIRQWFIDMEKLHGKKRFNGLVTAAKQLGGSKKVPPPQTAIDSLRFFEVRGILRGGFEEILSLYRQVVASAPD
jgi:hypothetical protein